MIILQYVLIISEVEPLNIVCCLVTVARKHNYLSNVHFKSVFSTWKYDTIYIYFRMPSLSFDLSTIKTDYDFVARQQIKP